MILYLALGLVALALIGAVHWYLWKRLVADVSSPGSGWRRVGTVLAVLLGLLVPATLVGARVLSPGGAGRILAWPGYLWLALLAYLFIALVILEVPRAIIRAVWRHRSPAAAVTAAPTGDDGTPGAGPDRAAGSAVPDDPARDGVTPDDPAADGGAPEGVAAAAGGAAPVVGTPISAERRRFLARSLALVAGVGAAGTVGYGLWAELSGPVIKRIEIPLTRLDPQLDGFRVAVVSDIHLGPTLQRGFAARVVDAINAQRPDLITIVGDLVDGTVAQLGAAAEPLRDLSAPHGAYFVTGNHEYFSGVTEWVEEVRELGVHPLRNQHTEIIGGSAAFDLAGVNDATGGDYSAAEAPNYAAALRDRDPARPVVLLAHQPVQVHQAARYGVDLQLSGHTHGGQMWPVQYAVRLQQPVVSGLARIDGTTLYVTNGAGAWGPPVRVGARPDITVVTLRSTR